MKLKSASFIALISVFVPLFGFYSLSSNSITNAIPSELDLMISQQQSLPRSIEAGYSPLGRSPVVDAVLSDPFYLPQYGKIVAGILKEKSQNKQLLELTSATLTAGGIPLSTFEDRIQEVQNTPYIFHDAFGAETGNKIYAYWHHFLNVYQEIEEIFSPLSESEKEWLRHNHNRFFFDHDHDYDFFTTNSAMPFKFFQLASRIDLAKLADCARKLTIIVDDFQQHADEFATAMLKEDFIWFEKGLKLHITTKDHANFSEDADFFIDLGGNNTFSNNAGGTRGVKAASLHIDLFGHNHFVGDQFVQGSGFLGVGILASLSGNNTFVAQSYSQGSGFFGVGFLMSLKGNNHFEIDFAGQSFASFGSSILWNVEGNNSYIAHFGLAQAASSTLGVAFLIDNQGNNTFNHELNEKADEGIGQGGSTGVRNDPWIGRPSLYGGVAFLFVGGGNNVFKSGWLAQGSGYFLSAGILVAEGSNDKFYAKQNSQGQALHLSAGLLLSKGDGNSFDGGWGSIASAADRSSAMLLSVGGNNTFIGGDHSVGSARKPKALSIFINTEGNNYFEFGKNSNANVQKPISPSEWPKALFLSLGENNRYPFNRDSLLRGTGLSWHIGQYGLGIDHPFQSSEEELFNKFPEKPRNAFSFNPNEGWKENVSYRPLEQISNSLQLQYILQELPTANVDRRRQIYEAIDLLRFSYPNFSIDLSQLLQEPASLSPDLLDYTLLWAINNNQNKYVNEVITALENSQIESDLSRKLAILFVAKMGGKRAHAILVKLIFSDPNEENRAMAALWYATFGSLESLDTLKLASVDESEMVRYAIVTGLVKTKIPNAMEIITSLFNDNSFYVRRAAGLSAISLKNKEGVDVVLETLQYDTLDTTENYGNNIFNKLAAYLGVNFGLNKEAWMHWWCQVKESYSFPKVSP